jgi:hypothetical protein
LFFAAGVVGALVNSLVVWGVTAAWWVKGTQG